MPKKKPYYNNNNYCYIYKCRALILPGVAAGPWAARLLQCKLLSVVTWCSSWMQELVQELMMVHIQLACSPNNRPDHHLGWAWYSSWIIKIYMITRRRKRRRKQNQPARSHEITAATAIWKWFFLGFEYWSTHSWSTQHPSIMRSSAWAYTEWIHTI